MLQPDEGDEYQARLRLTETNRGFGNQGSVGESYRGNDPSQIIDSITSDIAELRASVNELDSASANRNSVVHDINNLRVNLGDKIQAAKDAINGKVAQGEKDMVIKRLRAQLDKAIKDEKQLLEQLLKKQRTHSVRESTMDSSYPSSGGEGNKGFEGVDHTLDQVQTSALEQREKEAHDIMNLERDILDLNEMHKDLNEHVNDQGENLDRIDQHTEVAAVNVAKGTENTSKIRDLVIKNRKMMFIIIAIISGIVLFIVIIIIIIGAYLGTRK